MPTSSSEYKGPQTDAACLIADVKNFLENSRAKELGGWHTDLTSKVKTMIFMKLY